MNDIDILQERIGLCIGLGCYLERDTLIVPTDHDLDTPTTILKYLTPKRFNRFLTEIKEANNKSLIKN